MNPIIEQSIQCTYRNKNGEGKFILISIQPPLALLPYQDVFDEWSSIHNAQIRWLETRLTITRNQHLKYLKRHRKFTHISDIPETELQLRAYIYYKRLEGLVLVELKGFVDVETTKCDEEGFKKICQVTGKDLRHIKKELTVNQSYANGRQIQSLEEGIAKCIQKGQFWATGLANWALGINLTTYQTKTNTIQKFLQYSESDGEEEEDLEFQKKSDQEVDPWIMKNYQKQYEGVLADLNWESNGERKT